MAHESSTVDCTAHLWPIECMLKRADSSRLWKMYVELYFIHKQVNKQKTNSTNNKCVTKKIISHAMVRSIMGIFAAIHGEYAAKDAMENNILSSSHVYTLKDSFCEPKIK